MLSIWKKSIKFVCTHQSNGQKVQNGGGAAEQVKWCPNVAEKGAQCPALRDLREGTERHYQTGDHQVGHRQREHQVVARRAQVSLHDDRRNDENIAHDGHHSEDAQHYRGRHQEDEAVLVRLGWTAAAADDAANVHALCVVEAVHCCSVTVLGSPFY